MKRAQQSGHASEAVRRLDEVDVGSRVVVVGVDEQGDTRRRLLEMGFCNGVSVEVVRRAPLGDPVEFYLRGYYLSLRREQARHVRVALDGRKAAVE